MANGNQGSDFNQFLSTLVSASQANERLKVQKDALALQEMSTMSQSNYRDYLMESSKADARRQDFKLEATALAGYPELQKDWLKSQPFIKKNPEYVARLDATFAARGDIDDRIFAANAYDPITRMGEWRKILLDKNITKTQVEYITAGMAIAREEGSTSPEEMGHQPSYPYLLGAQSKLKTIAEVGRRRDPKNPLKFTETIEQFEGRKSKGVADIVAWEKVVTGEEVASRAPYQDFIPPKEDMM